MNWVLGIAVAPLVGLVVGFSAELIPMPELARTVAATFVAWILVVVALVWIAVRFRVTGPNSYFGIGLDNLGWLLLGCVAAGALHVALGYAGSMVPFVVQHRPTVITGAISMYLGFSFARLLREVNRVERYEL